MVFCICIYSNINIAAGDARHESGGYYSPTTGMIVPNESLIMITTTMIIIVMMIIILIVTIEMIMVIVMNHYIFFHSIDYDNDYKNNCSHIIIMIVIKILNTKNTLLLQQDQSLRPRHLLPPLDPSWCPR